MKHPATKSIASPHMMDHTIEYAMGRGLRRKKARDLRSYIIGSSSTNRIHKATKSVVVRHMIESTLTTGPCLRSRRRIMHNSKRQ